MRKSLLLLALALVLTLAGCGGGGSASASGPPPVTQLAAKIGCSNGPDPSPAIFVKEDLECQVDGEDVTVSTFGSGQTADLWLKMAQAFGGFYVVGPGSQWIVSMETRAVATAVQAKLGGKVQ